MNVNLKIIILSIFIFLIILILIIPIFIIVTEYKLNKYKLYVKISCFIFRKLNKTKIKIYKNKDKNLSNFNIQHISKEEPIKCEICYQEYDHETKDKFMCFSCCKYKNIMCEKCISHYYKIKNKEFSLFSTIDCPFCTQKIYVCNFQPDVVLNISQNYFANTSNV